MSVLLAEDVSLPDQELDDLLKWWCNLSSKQKHMASQAKSEKASPNSICPCGSGKKYKKCCA